MIYLQLFPMLLLTFGGRQKTLSDEDKAFLDRIREAQDSSADMTLFQDSEISIGESVSEPEPEVS